MSTTPEIQSRQDPDTTHHRQSLAVRAKALAPAFRQRAAETNQLRRLPDSTWKDLVETGIVRGLQPARWGGGELHPREFYSAVIEVARAEGCAGWVAGIIGRASLADCALLSRNPAGSMGRRSDDNELVLLRSYRQS